MTPSPARRRIARSARIAGVVLIVVASTGNLPHLVATQAALSALLTMVVAPLWLLDPGDGRWLARVRRVKPFPAVFLVSAGTILAEMPGVVGPISGGGALTALALSALLLGAIAFWTMVIPPEPRVGSIGAAAYVIVGGVPISMPAMVLILAPQDMYAGFHAAAPGPLDGRTDQLLAGFILFAAVKIVIFTVATLIFVRVARETPDEDFGDDHDDRPPARVPDLPSWVRELDVGPLPDEPAAVPQRPVSSLRAPSRATRARSTPGLSARSARRPKQTVPS